MGQSTSPKTISSVVHNLPERNRFFTGREETLSDLHKLLIENKEVATKQAISGLGGMGKTQTAIELCYRCINKYQYIFWTNAENETEINNSYSHIAKLLPLTPIADLDAMEITSIVQLLKLWLENNLGWLMVLDNLEDVSLLKQYLPNHHKGHILITTQTHNLGYVATTTTLEKMDENTGSSFLFKRAFQNKTLPDKADCENLEAAKNIVKEMDGLPLALDQAAAYVQNSDCTLQRYLSLYKDAKHAARLRNKRGKYTDAHTSVTATFSLAFDKVKEKSSLAAELLDLFSLLSPDLIPEEIFTKAGYLLGDNLTLLVGDDLLWDETLEVLFNYSLIKRDSSNRSLSIHRLIQEVIKDLMDPNVKEYLTQSLTKALAALLPPGEPDEPTNWPEYKKILSNTLTLTRFGNQPEHFNIFLFEEAAKLFNNVGLYCYTQAFYSEASKFYQQALSIAKSTLGGKHPFTATILNNVASIYNNQKNYSQALDLYLQALSIYEDTVNNNPISTANTLNNVASTYNNLGNYSQALVFYKKAFSIYVSIFGYIHTSVATVLNNVGHLYIDKHDYLSGLGFYWLALFIYETTLGDSHLKANSLNNIASVYQSQRNYKEAEKLYLEALQIKKQVLGEKNIKTVETIINLGHLYQDTSRENQAIDCYKEALGIYDQLLPINHTAIIEVLTTYSDLLCQLNREDEAQPLLNLIKSLKL